MNRQSLSHAAAVHERSIYICELLKRSNLIPPTGQLLLDELEDGLREVGRIVRQAAADTRNVSARVRQCLAENGAPMTVAEIRDRTGADYSRVATALQTMVNRPSPRVRRVKPASPTEPQRWTLVSTEQEATQ